MYVPAVPVYYAAVPYVVPVVPTPVIFPPMFVVRDQFCPYCGHVLYWSPMIAQWYCSRCRIYIPPVQPKRTLF
ncbi:MAG: hypothetical protein QXO32_03245 [Candidatus Bathyarchaeia archaeon]